MGPRRLRRSSALCLTAAALASGFILTAASSGSATGLSAARATTAATAAAGVPAPVASTYFSFTSDPGDWVGGGLSEEYTPASSLDFSISGTDQHLAVSVRRATEFWDADIAPGAGDRLRPGVFSNVQSYPFQTGRDAGLNIDGDGRGCSGVGTFVVHQIAFDASGAITMADISISQHCDYLDAPVLNATIHLNQYPLSYRQTSAKNEYIGRGRSKTYDNSTSVMTFTSRTAKLIRMRESGLGDTWAVELKAPAGKKLAAGKTYTTSIRSSSRHAGLNVHGNGRTCKTATGSLTINQLIVSATGRVTHLSASFTQHCNGKKPALHGTIHYFA